jgi:phosphoribosylaminoimidazole carboxylase (NCAIR synthetase)
MPGSPATDGHGGAIDLAWADPAARAANDRSRTLAIAHALGVALPGARLVTSLAELDEHLGGFAGRPWICKARWTAAGRDRARGDGSALGGELRARIARMLERFGPLVFEPWLDRVADVGVCGAIAADGEVALCEPHRLISDPRGGFLGIDLAPVDRAIAGSFGAVARAAAARVAAQTGYRGPFAIDGFVHRDRGEHQLHPLCELNARYSFGWIAHGLARRLGIRRLGFDAPPPGATVLIAPGDDRVTAWCA